MSEFIVNRYSHVTNIQHSDSMILSDDFLESVQTIELNNKDPKSNDKLTIQLIEYAVNQYSNSLFSKFEIEAPTNINSLSIQRKASFLAGRLAVKNAFLDLDIRPENIKAGLHKQPIWPNNIVGSISHCNSYSIATLNNISSYIEENIGIDFQDIISQKDIELIRNTVLTEPELNFLGMDEEGWNQEQIFTLIFSAKESYFKAMYPQVRQYFNFIDITISSIDFTIQQLTIAVEKKMNVQIDLEKEYQVNFDVINLKKPYILSYCRI